MGDPIFDTKNVLHSRECLVCNMIFSDFSDVFYVWQKSESLGHVSEPDLGSEILDLLRAMGSLCVLLEIQTVKSESNVQGVLYLHLKACDF